MEKEMKIQIDEPSFAEEIFEEILSRLPVDSLLKLRCVSKSWRSLIDSDRFIKIHLKNSTENENLPHHLIILNPILPRNRVLKMFSWESLLEEPIANPFEYDAVKDIDRDVSIVGCCNGLVCLVQDRGRFILWNPSTRMSIGLPDADTRPVSIMNVNGDNFPMYGFGYDECSDDYKVFTIVASNNYVIRPPICRIYSLKSDSWRTLEDKHSPYGGDKAGKFVSGNLNWIGDEEDVIVSFDLKNETFGVVELPSYSDEMFVVTQTLGEIGGCLSVLCDYRNSHFDVWVMEEYGVKESWVYLYTIPNINHPPLRTQAVRSFFIGPDEEFLLIYGSNLVLYCYYSEDDVYACPVIISMDRVMGEGVFVESLVSLGPNAEEESIF